MKKLTPQLPNIISYFFIFLWVYAGMSKVLDFENFQVQLAQSPLLSAYAGIVSYAVIILEIIIAIILCFSQWRIWGLYASYTLMVAMITYIFLILNYSDFIPCSCGGILEKMTWSQHLVFNIACVILSVIGIIIEHKDNKWFISKLLVMLFVIAVSGMIALFMSSEHIMKKENNFTRRFLPHPLIENKYIELDNPYFQILGHDNRHLILTNRTTPQTVYKVNFENSKITNHNIFSSNNSLVLKRPSIQFSNPNLYIVDGTIPLIHKVHITDSILKEIHFNKVYFNQIAIIDSNRFIVRIKKSKDKKMALSEVRHNSPQNIFYNLSSPKTNNILESDGKLWKDYKNKWVYYLFYYQNKILIIDLSKNKLDSLQLKGVVDFNTKNLIQTTDNQYKIKNPNNLLNATSNGDLVFVKSKTIAKSFKTFETTIDIYDISNHQYNNSFKIETDIPTGFKNFLVTDHFFYLMTDKKVYQYSYRPKTKHFFKKGEAENLN